jgi:hypothetical protein
LRAAGATNTLLRPQLALSLSSQSVLIIVSVLHIIGFNKAIKVIAFLRAHAWVKKSGEKKRFAFGRLALMVFYLNLHQY